MSPGGLCPRPNASRATGRALLAVNPVAVWNHRRIWPPRVLPVFVVVMLMCWFRRDFLAQPYWHGQATWLVGALHAAAAIAAVYVIATAIRSRVAGDGPRRWSFADPAPTTLVQNGVLWGYGLLLTVSLVQIHHHYQIIALPFEMLWLARLVS